MAKSKPILVVASARLDYVPKGEKLRIKRAIFNTGKYTEDAVIGEVVGKVVAVIRERTGILPEQYAGKGIEIKLTFATTLSEVIL